MKITEVSAENFLSFGRGEDAFCLKDVNGSLTVLVGPNGAGKSNVLRVVEAVLGTLRGTQGDIASARHLPDGQGRYTELRLGIRFDRPEEQECIFAFLKATLAYPGSNGYSAIAQVRQKDGKTAGNSVIRQRQDALAAWIDQHVDREDFAPLYQGVLRLILDPELGDNANLIFEFSIDGTACLALGMSGRNVIEGSLRPAPQSSGNTSHHITRAWVDAQPDDVRTQLAEFLQGSRDDQPDLPVLPLQAFIQHLSQGNDHLSSELEGNRDPSRLVRQLVVTGTTYGLNTDHDNLAKVVSLIITSSIAIFSDWHPELESTLLDEYVFATRAALLQSLTTAGGIATVFGATDASALADPGNAIGSWLRAPLANLAQGELSRYLLRLQHGDEREHSLYEDIQTTFHSLTDHRCHVRIEAQPTRDGYPRLHSVRMRLETDSRIPLSSSGSGIGQGLYLSAVLHGYPGCVLLLDEPEAHLHPTLKSRLPDLLQDAASRAGGQYVVIAHSPYAVPTPSFTYARRIYAHAGHSMVSAPLTTKELEHPGLRIQTKAQGIEEKAFLFSNVTCFVEGPRDAAAYASWFDLWAEEVKRERNYATKLGLVFQAAGGADRLTGMLMVARRMGVPTLGGFDTDVLSADKDHRDGNIKRIALWVELGLARKGRISLNDATSLRELGKHPAILRVLQPDSDSQIQFNTDLEDVLREAMQGVSIADGRESPSAYGAVAREHGLPKDHREFFSTLFKNLTRLAVKAKR